MLIKIKIGLQLLVDKQKEYFIRKSNKEELKQEIKDLKIEILYNQVAFNKENEYSKSAISLDLGFGLSKKDIIKQQATSKKIKELDELLNKLDVMKVQPEKDIPFFNWKIISQK